MMLHIGYVTSEVAIVHVLLTCLAFTAKIHTEKCLFPVDTGKLSEGTKSICAQPNMGLPTIQGPVMLSVLADDDSVTSNHCFSTQHCY